MRLAVSRERFDLTHIEILGEGPRWHRGEVVRRLRVFVTQREGEHTLRGKERWLSAASQKVSSGLARWHAWDDRGVERLRDVLVGQWERAQHASPARRRQVRRAVSLALQHLPAVDPTRDPWLSHALPPVAPPREGGSVLVTGATGFVGTHLLSFLLRETDRKVVCVVRTPEKLAASAREYGLDLEGMTERVTFLRGLRR